MSSPSSSSKQMLNALSKIEPLGSIHREDGSILTRINNIVVHLDGGLLGKILRVPREGTQSVLGRTCSAEFGSVISKTPTTKVAGIYKKIMKSDYQLVFQFINKVLLPRTEKRTVATTADLFVMEMLCSFEALNLPGLMLEQIYKTVIERKGVNGMGYGYVLTEVFKHFRIPLSVGKVGTVKQTISESTLVECECIEGRGYPKSKMAQLIEDPD